MNMTVQHMAENYLLSELPRGWSIFTESNGKYFELHSNTRVIYRTDTFEKLAIYCEGYLAGSGIK